MSHKRQTFLIPQLNVLANDADLKTLQHKMLYNHYEQQSQDKLHRSYSQRKMGKSYVNPQIINTDYDDLKNSVIRMDKRYQKQLAQSYNQQIQRKNNKYRQIKMNQLKIQQQIIERAQRQMYLDKQRNYQIQQGFKRQAQQIMNDKQKRKQQEKLRLQQQKKNFQRKFENNLLSLNKLKKFQDHYQNVDGAFAANTRIYLDQVLPKNRQIQRQKQRLVQVSLQRSQIKMRQKLMKQKQALETYRNDLRSTLMNQIRQKQEKKKFDQYVQKSQGYTSQAYLKRHHPINNPVDFKITHDNKYIINELQTGLARRGSQSLLS